jgi:Transcriptional activator of glycolytic enzymes
MGNFEHDTNPIEKTQVGVYSTGTNLHIDPVAVALGEVNAAGINAPINAPNNGMNNQAVMAQVNAIRVQNSEVMNMLRTQHEVLQEELKQLKRIVARFANRPAQVSGGFFARRQPVAANATVFDDDDGDDGAIIGGPVGEHPVEYAVSLSSCPRNLYALWEEYEFGLNGQKAAKRFTSRERGRVRYKYTRRKIVWDRITLMIRQGHTYLTAIDELHRIYGAGMSVTDIINRMRTERNGG